MTNSKIVLSEQPCPRIIECGSSDAYFTYDDGHGYCYSCCTYFPPKGEKRELTEGYTYEFLPYKGLNKETVKKYNIQSKIDKEGEPIAVGYIWPNGATQVESLLRKDFHWAKGPGIPDPEPGLFGMDKFSSGEHKYVAITEGAKDAASLHQATGIPVVSVQSAGSAVRDCSVARSYLNGFERIYLALDGDAPGREAAGNVARLFDPNKLYQLKFTKYKDSNDFLKAGEEHELRQIFHNARRYQPEAIISTFEEFEKTLLEAPRKGIPYPFNALNEMTYGIRTGETVLFTAQEGVGKTELMHAIEYQILKEAPNEVGVGAIFLEEPKRRHLQALAGLELTKPVHLPDTACTDSEVLAALRKAVGVDERLHIYSHFGSDSADILLDTVRFLVSARSCRYVLFDHISMAVSGLAGEDERRALDYLSTRLEMMVKELDFALLLVSHVNDEGKTRGSRYISKVADIRIDLTRDVSNVDPIIRNTTQLSVSKNRFSGKTGPSCQLLFDPKTYTFSEIENDQWKPANDNFPSYVQGRAA